MTKNRILLVAIVAITILFSSKANAQIKAEAMAGYGFKDGYNIGIGARAGKDGLIESQKDIYIGGVFAYHLGKTVESSQSFFGQTTTTKSTVNLWYLGGDVGYNVKLEGQSFKLRASAYVGIANISSKFETTGGGGGFGAPTSGSSSEFMLAPGATFFFPLGGDLTFGADARFFIVSNSNALVINATIGKTF
ncbi:MAG: hypothetical protein NZM06_11965 [Chloroherpetonaceae bacterium]|nr:hypothetical protein [Chloroherpetonaceae bacterium]MDW8438716.1 hypothetical protein [Chloroherpetonaceae bacterium]